MQQQRRFVARLCKKGEFEVKPGDALKKARDIAKIRGEIDLLERENQGCRK